MSYADKWTADVQEALEETFSDFNFRMVHDCEDAIHKNRIHGENYLGEKWGTLKDFYFRGEPVKLEETGDMWNAFSREHLENALKTGSFDYSAFPDRNKGEGSYAEIHQPTFKWHPEDFSGDYLDWDKDSLKANLDLWDREFEDEFDRITEELPDFILEAAGLK